MINVLLFLICIGGLTSLTLLKSFNQVPELFKIASSLPYHDKWAHFILMSILTYLTCSVFTPFIKTRGIKHPLLIIGFSIAAIITLEEMSQAYFPTGTCSWQDAACGLLGLITALYIYHVRELRKRELRKLPVHT